MHIRMGFEKSDSIGAFCKLTNSYVLIAPGAAPDYYDIFEGILSQHVPVIQSSIGGCRVVGRLCAGNKHGLLVPDCITESELQNLKENLPGNVKIGQVAERLCALGNIIACNDKIAVVHSDVDKETEQAIRDVLQVEVFTNTIPSIANPGAYMVLTNNKGLVCPLITDEEVEELSVVFDIPIEKSTINGRSPVLGAGIATNDVVALCGPKSTHPEIYAVLRILNSTGFLYDYKMMRRHQQKVYRCFRRVCFYRN